MNTRLLAAALASAAPVALVAQPAPVQPVVAQPAAVDPARLAAAERFMAAMWPDALFVRAADIAAGYVPLSETAPGDPHRAERVRLTRQAVSTEAAGLVRSFASELRTLSARYYARRLSQAELDEAARFYAGPAGQRFAMGWLEMPMHAMAMRDYSPQPDPELLVAFARVAQRVEAATAHLAPPPPPPPPPSAQRERRRRGEAPTRAPRPPMASPPEVVFAPAPPAPPRAPREIAPPEPPRAAPPAPPPIDPARLAAARRAAELVWPREAFSQPLPLAAALESVISLPIASFGAFMPEASGFGPFTTLGDVIDRGEPNARERARITARILAEELPTVLPLVAPEYQRLTGELYARTYTVEELDSVSRFYSTPAGRAVARESFAAFADPEAVRGLALLTPRVFADAVPAVVRIGQATVHLPPPPPAPPRPARPRAPEEDHDHH